MKTAFYNDFTANRAMINPVDVIKPIPKFPTICISTFSKQIIDKFAALEGVEVIGTLQTANGENPIYRIVYKGEEFAFYLSLVCAPASVSCMEEVIALGAKKFVFFGCCGVLDEELVEQKLIVPIAGIRDEGTSYHYIAPCDEIFPDDEATAILEETMKRCGCSYVTGKIWTTDAIYRETERAVKERKECGCVAVDMEYSALLAVAKYRKIPFIQFFYGADSLDNGEWNPRDLTDYGLSDAQKYFVLALECGLTLDGARENNKKEENAMGELSKLPNIGEVVEEQLKEVGITTYEQLKEVGSRQAWLKIQSIDPSACIHRLYSFEGAIRGIKKKDLPIDVKEDLKDFYNHFKM